ncbi:lipopolysaccharide biosynthesis protein [Waddlia chondrophila]|uniref:O-antigen translocase n=1 Tax=Waddlia chondrophila (strain ATCC VR-1470 / WSU 86-1044) TaxID=716544 RepID=D6YSW2_WADCW|nr:oligosaccharide flippase family protein [Waddlia chondrophila]ADI39157.1 O-antigen translocase [Waddlia chondrophila WSU 86-1044]
MIYFQKTLGNLHRIGFIQSVYTLMSGTVLAQIITLGISPILARFYSPEDFGYFALFFSISSLLGMISTGRYEFSLLLPKKIEDAFHLLLVCLGMTFLSSFLTFLSIYFFIQPFFPTIHNSFFSTFWGWIPLMVFQIGLSQTFTFWFNRTHNLHLISKGKIIQSLTSATLNLLLFFYCYQWLGGKILILSGLVSFFALNTYYIFHFFRKNHGIWKNFNHKNLLIQSKKYIDFPKYNLFHSLFDNFQIFGINFLFSLFYGPAVLGYYTLTHRVLKYPLSLLSTSLSQVFMEKFSSKTKLDIEKPELLKSIWKLLFLCGILPFLVLIFFGQEIFATIFGEQWRNAGLFSQILSLWYFLNFIYSPTSPLPLIIGKQKQFMYLGLAYNSAIISSFVFSYFAGLETITMLTFLSINMSIFTIFLMKWLYQLLSKEELE